MDKNSQILVIKNYKIVESLNKNSYIQTFKVRHQITDQLFTIKVYNIQSIVKQSKEHEVYIEKQILNNLNHIGIVKLIQSFKDENYLYLVMQYFEGGTLQNVIQKTAKYLSQCVQKNLIIKYYMSQLVTILIYLHKNGIAHRNINSETLILTQQGRLKLMDFNKCKILNNKFIDQKISENIQIIKESYPNQKRKSILTSLNYVSPEYIDGVFGYQIDIWNFGIILYRFYHNHYPFDGEDIYSMLKSVRSDNLIIDQFVDVNARDLISRTLEKNHKKRITIQQIQKHQFFEGIQFKNVFKYSLAKTSMTGELEIFKSEVEKKMFFGNYKKRILVLFTRNQSLILAYKYVETEKTKRQIILQKSYSAQKINSNQFLLKTKQNKYHFKCEDTLVDEWLRKINLSIREYFRI